MRRFSTQPQSNTPPPPANPVSRSQTTRSPRIPTDDFNSMSIGDGPPPPDYNTALNASLMSEQQSGGGGGAGAGAGRGQPQQQQQRPPQPQQQSRPLPLPSNNPFADPQPRPVQNQSQPPPRQNPTSPPMGGPAPAQAPAQAAPARSGTLNRQRTVEDPFGTLSRFDVVLLIDDSPSMHDLLDETTEVLMGLVSKAVQYDKDGLDCYFLNHSEPLLNCTEPSTIREYFESIELSGSTPTGFQLDEILRPYIESVEDAKATKTKVKPLDLIVITDGRADDSDMVKDVIIEMAQRLDDIRAPPYQLGIQFIQVGRDADASDFLRELDDDLKAEAGVRDIVDTTPYEGRLTTEFILKTVLGSVVKRLDN